MKLAPALVMLAGCSQLFGLEDTKLDYQDAPTDAPDVCDTPAFACEATTGRSACGRLYTPAGAPYTVAAPTGQACTGTEGPCGLMVTGQSLTAYFANTANGTVTAQVDDCGHFVIPDLDMAASDIVILVKGTDVATTGRLVFDRTTAVGTDSDIDALVVTTAVQSTWASQIGIQPSDLARAYLVRYLTNTGASSSMEVRIDGAAATATPPALPWARYFGMPAGTPGFDALDPDLTQGPTALVGPPVGAPFRLGGFRTGKTCGRDGLEARTGILYAVLPDC